MSGCEPRRVDAEVDRSHAAHAGPGRREQDDLVPARREDPGEVADDDLRATELWGRVVDRGDERRDEGDAQSSAP
jgi:hypothetical protein